LKASQRSEDIPWAAAADNEAIFARVALQPPLQQLVLFVLPIARDGTPALLNARAPEIRVVFNMVVSLGRS